MANARAADDAETGTWLQDIFVLTAGHGKLKEPLKCLNASPRRKKLIKLGVFWFPAPVISHAVAPPRIVRGKLLDRHYTGTTIKHVGLEATKTLKSLEEFLKSTHADCSG